MRAPIPTPEGLLPARAAIIIMGCLFVFLAALWLFVITKAMIAIGVGAVALFTAGGLCLRSSLCAETTVTVRSSLTAVDTRWLSSVVEESWGSG